MQTQEPAYRIARPDRVLSDFVESFWMLHNHSEVDREIVVLPDGRIDLFFSYSEKEPFHVALLGLETAPSTVMFAAKTRTFAISFKLPASEYLLQMPVADLINQARTLPGDFWGFTQADMADFDLFCAKATALLLTLLPKQPDTRKLNLFRLIYASDGALPVQSMSEQVGWGSRQINRYFNRQFGLSLKTYCTILRFRAAFQPIRNGKLFPELNFADQAHFIREVKKLAGVIPKELSKNQNDRFIQFSTLPPE